MQRSVGALVKQRVAREARKKQPSSQSRGKKKREASQSAEESSAEATAKANASRAIFDPDETLVITLSSMREVAASRAARNTDARRAEVALHSIETAMAALPTHFLPESDLGVDALNARQPESLEELQEELRYLEKKVGALREEARSAESAVRSRAHSRSRELTMEELLADKTVRNARSWHAAYSRRQVTLWWLKRPGAKFGPPLIDEEAELVLAPVADGISPATSPRAAAAALAESVANGGDSDGLSGVEVPRVDERQRLMSEEKEQARVRRAQRRQAAGVGSMFRKAEDRQRLAAFRNEQLKTQSRLCDNHCAEIATRGGPATQPTRRAFKSD